jgi:hypothetical protein
MSAPWRKRLVPRVVGKGEMPVFQRPAFASRGALAAKPSIFRPYWHECLRSEHNFAQVSGVKIIKRESLNRQIDLRG